MDISCSDLTFVGVEVCECVCVFTRLSGRDGHKKLSY